MEVSGVYDGVSILDVLAVWPCARAIFRHVPVHDLVRSERVSRRWQHAVRDHLHASRNFKLNCGYTSVFNETESICTIEIQTDENPWPILSKTVEKLGSYIVSFSTNCGDAEHLRIVEMNCPHLQHLEFFDLEEPECAINESGCIYYDSGFKELKHVAVMYTANIPNVLLNGPLQKIGFEKIEIHECETTGSFLNAVKTDHLNYLSITECYNVDTSELECIAYNLRNLTSLDLDYTNTEVLQNVHKLLNKAPKLEYLSLCGHKALWSKQKLLESISRLSNLKHLNLAHNENVDNEWIEVIVRECKQLKYLDISPVKPHCLRSVAALCRRPLPVVTTLCVGHIQNYTIEDLVVSFSRRPLVSELLALGYVEVTQQWLETTARASQGPDYIELRLKQTYKPVNVTQPLQELIVNLDSTIYCNRFHVL